jgi:hypothetical protein
MFRPARFACSIQLDAVLPMYQLARKDYDNTGRGSLSLA